MPGDEKQLAADRAARFQREAEQADMFGADGSARPPQSRGPGRPAGSPNRLKTKLREYMAAQGYRDPAVQLAMLAGLDRPDLHPMAYAAQIGEAMGEDMTAILREMRAASAELLPYWHAKLTPDIAIRTDRVGILMSGPDGAIGIDLGNGSDPFAPLDVRAGLIGQSVENQGLGDSDDDAPGASDRTE